LLGAVPKKFKFGKISRPFSLSSDVKLSFTKYMLPMLERDFGITGFQVRSQAYSLAEKYGTTDRFNPEKEVIESGFRKSVNSLFNRNA
jgi:hypothetical protein